MAYRNNITLLFSAFVFTFLPFMSQVSAGTIPFITTWETTSANESITIPTTGSGYSYTVNWGDGNTTSSHTGNASHTYLSPGLYTVSITGNFPRIYFNNAGDKAKVKDIVQWGDNAWISMERAFRGCNNLSYSAIDSPDLSTVTNFSLMFAGCSQFNGDIGSWNTQNVTDMRGMFYNATVFNQDIGGWNTQNVTNMGAMFNYASSFNQNIGNWNTQNVVYMDATFDHATAFNQDIGGWNTQNVVYMGFMFNYAVAFNQDIGGWNISNVGFMWCMFNNATVFNQDIGNWNTQKVVEMGSMFQRASAFNQDIGGWNTQNVLAMDHMFSGATAFNQDIGGWNTQSVEQTEGMFNQAVSFDQSLAAWDMTQVYDISYMLRNSGLSRLNYDSTLIGWSGQNVKPNLILHADGLEYCNGQAARNLLVSTRGWTIAGDTLNCAILGIDSETALTPVQVTAYPNPTTETITLEGSATELSEIWIVNLIGQDVTHKTTVTGKGTGQLAINLQRLEPGIYLVRTKTAVKRVEKL